MNQTGIALIASLGLAALAQQPAMAQASRGGGLTQQLFGTAGSVCYKRDYDTRHMATHPQQNVTSMIMLVRAQTEGGETRYVSRIGVKFRNKSPLFDVSGFCGKSETGLECGVECDGGSIGVAIRDAQTVQVSLPDGARMSPVDSRGRSPRQGSFASDDKVFRLTRTKPSDCAPLGK